MPWFNVDDSAYAHPKFMRLSLAATGLWMRAGAWCAQNMTDGWMPEWVLPLAGMAVDELDALVSQLEDADLWVRGVGGWQFKDWTDWNKTREWHEKQREANRERQRRWAEKGNEKRWSEPPDDIPYDGAPNAVTNALGDALLTSPNPTQVSSSVLENVSHDTDTDRSAIANDNRFDKFWAIAIRKTGKGNARKALVRALTKTSEHHLAAAWRAANQAWATWPDRSKVPHPATWLNQERWDDEPPQPHATSSKTLNALDRATQMEMTDDTSRLPATPRPSITAGPTGHAG